MGFSSDQILKLARTAYQSKRWDERLRYLTRCNNTPEVQGLRTLVSYEVGKALAAQGNRAESWFANILIKGGLQSPPMSSFCSRR